jgi:single-strand DNA-binding protein
MNQVCLIGNLTKDVELRYTPQETAVVNLSVAVNRNKDEVSFFDAVAFGKTAEICSQYLSKGSKVGISGRLQQDRWEKDGEKRSKVRIIINRIDFLDPKEYETATTS